MDYAAPASQSPRVVQILETGPSFFGVRTSDMHLSSQITVLKTSFGPPSFPKPHVVWLSTTTIRYDARTGRQVEPYKSLQSVYHTKTAHKFTYYVIRVGGLTARYILCGWSYLDKPDTTELLAVRLSESELRLSHESLCLIHQLLAAIPELIIDITCQHSVNKCQNTANKCQNYIYIWCQ